MFKNHLLIIGSIPTDDPQSYGGTTVLVKQLLEYVEEQHIDFIFIQANKYKGRLSILKNYIYIIYQTLKNINKTDKIFVNVARNGAFYLSPILIVISKLFRKKFIFRIFGGNFLELLNKNLYTKKIAKYFLFKSDVIFVETKEVLDFIKKYNKHTYWFPNTRKHPLLTKQNINYEKKYVFISSVKRTKGIDEIVNVKKLLDDSFTIDIYGPIQDEKYSIEYFQTQDISFKGSIKPNDVQKVLVQYDVLLLPTYHEGEGYPGIIIEAYSLGIPCITTTWKAIPEIVDNYKTGILMPIKNVKELKNAIEYFDTKNYITFTKNAKEKFLEFEYYHVYKNIFSILKGLI